MTSKNFADYIGIGPTSELNLRVSVATLARVTFAHPEDARPMLALEHKAFLDRNGAEQQVRLQVQPFGGAIQILQVDRLLEVVDSFNFDSHRSRSESDFRIYIRPADWPAVQDYCLENFRQKVGSNLESDPDRELVEEFNDALGIDLMPDHYGVRVVNTVLENKPAATDNIHAAGRSTVRIYRVFEATILQDALAKRMLANSRSHSPDILHNMVLQDARNGGPGRANAIYVTPMGDIRDAYLALPPTSREQPLNFEDVILEGNVPVILQDVSIPKFRYMRG